MLVLLKATYTQEEDTLTDCDWSCYHAHGKIIFNLRLMYPVTYYNQHNISMWKAPGGTGHSWSALQPQIFKPSSICSRSSSTSTLKSLLCMYLVTYSAKNINNLTKVRRNLKLSQGEYLGLEKPGAKNRCHRLLLLTETSTYIGTVTALPRDYYSPISDSISMLQCAVLSHNCRQKLIKYFRFS